MGNNSGPSFLTTCSALPSTQFQARTIYHFVNQDTTLFVHK